MEQGLKRGAAGSPPGLREAVLASASRILAAEGHRNLTMRRIAADAGCSTMMLYTLFGAKSTLIAHVHDETFRLLAASLAEEIAGESPLDRLLQLGHAYRRFALEHSSLYLAVFSRPVPQLGEPVSERRRKSPSFTPLVDAVRDAAEAGLLDRECPAETQAELLWATVHGYVSLELAGYFAHGEAKVKREYDLLLRACIAGLRTAANGGLSLSRATTSRRRKKN